MPAGIAHPVTRTRRPATAHKRAAAPRPWPASTRRGKPTDSPGAVNERDAARPLAELGVAIDEPEPWEATAVDLTRCSNREKNAAWRHIKAKSPAVADAIKRDLPALQAAFGAVGVHVPAQYIQPEEDDHG